jgi:hypothetical protein
LDPGAQSADACSDAVMVRFTLLPPSIRTPVPVVLGVPGPRKAEVTVMPLTLTNTFARQKLGNPPGGVGLLATDPLT